MDAPAPACPEPPGKGEPAWCGGLSARLNTHAARDIDGDGRDDYVGVRAYVIDRATLALQDPAAPASMAREGFPADCRYALLVPHGGGVEPGTEQLARAIVERLPAAVAGRVVAWVVGGRNSVRNLCTACLPEGCPAACNHVRSTAIDPGCPDGAGETAPAGGPAAPSMPSRLHRTLDACPTGLAIHGHDGADVVVGGADLGARRALIDRLRAAAREGRFAAQFEVREAGAAGTDGLGGAHACNVVNRFTPDRNGAGVQIELPEALRPGSVRLPAARDAPLYFHRHEAQAVEGDPAALADLLAAFVCDRADGGPACAGAAR